MEDINNTDKKNFYIEYIITNATVVHNYVAELYWYLVKNVSFESILDCKIIVHLPQADNNLIIQSHESYTGNGSIINYKTLSLEITNIAPYKYENIGAYYDFFNT